MRILSRTLVLPLLVLLAGCGGRQAGAQQGQTLYSPSYAAGFEILPTSGASTILSILNPWPGAKNKVQEVFISRQGEKAPDGFNGMVVESSPRRIACMSSSHIAFLDAIGSAGRVVGVSGKEYITNPIVCKAVAEGRAKEIGYDAAANYEVLSSLRPDIIFIYSTSGENTALTSKLSELGLKYVYIGDYLEHSALGKSEWLVAFGELLDCREEAEEIFGEMAERYESLRITALNFSTKPKVMLNAPYRDVWFVPADNSYIVNLITDAGGEYVCKGMGGETSKPISGESAYLYISKADYWINPNSARSLREVVAANPKFAAVGAVKNHKVYNCTARSTAAGGSDFWESGAVRADRVLADFIEILHPENELGLGLYYYQRLE